MKLLVGLLALLAVFNAQRPVLLSGVPRVFDPRFGAVEAFRARGRADAAGVRWSRLVFNWGSIQPNGPRSWNWFYFPEDALDFFLLPPPQAVRTSAARPMRVRSWNRERKRITRPPAELWIPMGRC